jgi:hypothetical protein
MATSLHFVGRLSDGVPPIEILLKARKLNSILDYTTGAKIVEILLNDPKNRSIILNQWWKLEQRGMVVGMIIETDCLCLRPNCKSCAKPVITVKPIRRIKGDGNARRNKN